MQPAQADLTSNLFMAEETKQTTTSAAAPRGGYRPQGGRPQGGARGNGRGPRQGGDRNGRRNTRKPEERQAPEFAQKIIDIRRVTRVVAGGRRFAFSVAMVIGDKQGRVGVGLGKATDTSLAIQKAINSAKKGMIRVKLTETKSIPHDSTVKYSSARLMIMPNGGRGLVAGSSLRNVLELAGITDVTGKVNSGSKNKLNIARAAIKALAPFADAAYDPRKVERRESFTNAERN